MFTTLNNKRVVASSLWCLSFMEFSQICQGAVLMDQAAGNKCYDSVPEGTYLNLILIIMIFHKMSPNVTKHCPRKNFI